MKYSVSPLKHMCELCFILKDYNALKKFPTLSKRGSLQEKATFIIIYISFL